MRSYLHTQHALWMWIVLAIPIVVILTAWSTHPMLDMGLPAAVVIVPVLLLGAIFTRLTIAVDATAVRWHFGWGWPGGAIAIGDIARAEITQTNLAESWGIHWTIWHGWLWNAAGFQAVQIFKTNGGGVTLGTDDPQGLAEAIERFRRGAA
jgi:hypothetical protein